MELHEAMMFIQPVIGLTSIIVGVLIIVLGYTMSDPDKIVNHQMLGAIKLRSLNIIAGAIMFLFGGFLI